MVRSSLTFKSDFLSSHLEISTRMPPEVRLKSQTLLQNPRCINIHEGCTVDQHFYLICVSLNHTVQILCGHVSAVYVCVEYRIKRGYQLILQTIANLARANPTSPTQWNPVFQLVALERVIPNSEF